MNKISKLLLAVLVSTAAGSALADSALITYEGKIQDPTCTIKSDSASQTIDLKTASVSDFKSVGAVMNATAFNIQLIDCTPGITASMTVAGTSGSVPNVLRNTGSAANLGVQLLLAANVNDTTGSPIVFGNVISRSIATTTHTVPMVAQMYRTGNLGAGTVAATATVSFTYN
ncbi:fimbrial protein [Caballeronia peredens]|nr:fimbrial protein [Caballeronia peredens]